VAINVVEMIYLEVIWHVKRGDKLSKIQLSAIVGGNKECVRLPQARG